MPEGALSLVSAADPAAHDDARADDEDAVAAVAAAAGLLDSRDGAGEYHAHV